MTFDPRFRSVSTRSRRHLLWTFGVGAAGVVLAGCQGQPDGEVSRDDDAAAPDFAARFAAFEPADEPNGDLAKVVWPDFVLKAGADVQRLYEFQVINGDLMRYMPCFCGCGESTGHRNNRDCYIEAVNSDGSVLFDAMAPT